MCYVKIDSKWDTFWIRQWFLAYYPILKNRVGLWYHVAGCACVRLCVCMCISPTIVARERLIRNVTAVTDTDATMKELLHASCGPCRMKESRRVVFPRTSCSGYVKARMFLIILVALNTSGSVFIIVLTKCKFSVCKIWPDEGRCGEGSWCHL
jgi:hypothetical protein